MTTIAMEEYELMKDSKYRMYVAAVDKALKNFEYTSEWPDLISALGKLNKVLLNYTKYPVIPRRIKISKRLAQCMHPALPSGVHLKALETYDVIFKCMGTNRLSHELFIYSAGLFPLLGHSAMNVRPSLLKVYETHFVPLGERLRPALSGFLSGVLPGLESGSDHFERTNSLLEKVCDGVGSSWFYTCIWQCVRSNSPVRLPAISYVLQHFNKKLSMEDQLYLMGNDIDVMVSGLCAGVQDSSVLVQRSALDLLLVGFPMHNTQLLYADMVRLVTSSLTTILRRDMSLNRRLYSWLLGTEVNVAALHSDHPLVKHINASENKSHTEKYFELYSIDILVESIQIILSQSSSKSTIDIKPYRLLTSLLDKPQIGPVILDTILYDVFRGLYLTCLTQNTLVYSANSGRSVSFNGDISSLKYGNKNVITKEFLSQYCAELTKNANLLFNTLEAYYIWNYLGKLYENAISNGNKDIGAKTYHVNEIGTGKPNILEICTLTEFLLDVIPIETYIDKTSEILPNLFVNIVTIMKENIKIMNKNQITQSLELCTKILNKIQPVVNIKKLSKTPETPLIEENLSTDSLPLKPTLKPKDTLDEKEVRFVLNCLEKSKSDSKINEKSDLNMGNDVSNSGVDLNSLGADINLNRDRSNSNQMLKNKKTSPRIDKKSKNKKSKSSSKLYDLKRDTDSVSSTELLPQKEPKDDAPNLKTQIRIQIKTENKHILQCLKVYKMFYVKFITVKILPEVNIQKSFEKILQDAVDNRTKDLEDLLTRSLESNIQFSIPKLPQTTLPIFMSQRSYQNYHSDYILAMRLASNILLEFNSFPDVLEHSFDENDIPFWLKSLIICACNTVNQKQNPEIQMIAMNALLEMLSLAKTQNFERDNNDNNTEIVIMGILDGCYVNFIENSTRVIEVMAQILWEFLGIFQNQNHILTCITLLYQIHNIFETKNCVEHVIGQYLISENLTVEFFKRFSMLWHLGRDLDIKIPVKKRTIRNFDRSLLKIYDNLQNAEKVNLRLLSETFLVQSLLRNDITRLINPLFMILLTPNTARISIIHVHIQKNDEKLNSSLTDLQKIEDASMKKIRAISSVNGNVVYHVTENVNVVKPTKIKSFLFSKAGKKTTGVVDMTTSISENASIVTKKNSDFKNYESPNVENLSPKSNVKLFINPLSSKELYPNGIMGSYTSVKFDSISDDQSSSESISSFNENSTSLESNQELTKSEENEAISIETEPQKSTEVNKSSSKSNIPFVPSLTSATKHIHNYLEQIEPITDGLTDVTVSSKEDLSEKIGHPTRLIKSHSLDEKSTETDKTDYENNGLVHSWSYSMADSEKIDTDLELSTAADEFFTDPIHLVTDILDEILEDVFSRETKKSKRELKREKNLKKENERNRNNKAKIKIDKPFNIFPIHHHILLYCDVFDSNQILYAFNILKNNILTNPRLFITCLATNGLQATNNTDLLHLLAKHRKSVFGCGFSGELQNEYINFYRGFMFLEVLVTICLNYARSYYPNLDNPHLNDSEIQNNLKIHLASLELLDIIVKNLISLVNENAKGFSSYIGDMLSKCKLQKILLHCLLTSVRNFDSEMTFAEEILMFNKFQLYDENKKISEHMESYQIQLLRLVQSLIILEHKVFLQQENPVNATSTSTVNEDNMKYTPTVLIPQQQMFLSAILSALRHQNIKSLHQNWCNMITSCLPYMGQNLKQIALSIIHQICNNIEKIAEVYKSCEITTELTADYAITQLEALTIICHYCLLDSQQSSSQINTLNSVMPLSNPSQIFNNLLNVFLPPITYDGIIINKQNSDFYILARKNVLSHMPRIISSVAKLWQVICTSNDDFNSIFGYSKVVKQQLLEFLSPISLHHSANFLAAVAVAWYDRRNTILNNKKVLPEPNTNQKNLVYLISAIRVIPIDNLVQTVHAVIKSPPATEGHSMDLCLDVAILELFYCYMQNATGLQLLEAWGSLLGLFRESIMFSPPAQFLLIAILHELMLKCCPLPDRKDQKDLQDATAKLIESISTVCGSCLEQTTWLRRNLAVKEEVDSDTTSISSKSGSFTENTLMQLHSVQAQLVLAEILAPVLDICFGSQEKDKVITILTSLMYNIVPYLKTHTLRNMASFYACSKLLASLSSYPYTRKAWRKDVFDLLLDNNLFQMEQNSLKYWKIIIDNLMTHDNTTFRDLMSRVSLTQSGSLSLFSSREQEYEQRAQLLKRLAFVILCSEMDQYSKYMPDIQEQLASSLRLCVPGVQAQVFLCFRVMLLRMSPIHVTSLWPIIISEMLQVFLQIEQELSTDTEEFSSHIKLLSTLDASWTTNSNNGLNAHGHPHWLQLQLATAKLLDLALILPATALPQFQMYRWAFVGEDLTSNNSKTTTFIPHVTRIANLMDKKYTDTTIETLPTKQNELLLTINQINSLRDLHSFFKTLSLCSNRHRTDCNGSMNQSDHGHTDRQTYDKKLTAVLEKLDRVIEVDFLDKIPR